MRSHPVIILAALIVLPSVALGEEAQRREPLLGLYIQPMLSVTLPAGSGTDVTDVYGYVQPTGAVGMTIHPVRRFTLGIDLEIQGWRGELQSFPAGDDGTPAIDAFPLRFLNYWFHLRGRIMLVRRGRVQLDLDTIIGILVGREDGERFRARGPGVSLGLGPVLSVALGNYVALSFSAIFESGWIFYDIQSPQSQMGAIEYTLAWPRFLLGMGIHFFLAHRRASSRGNEPSEQAPPTEEPSPQTEEQPLETPFGPQEGEEAPAEEETPEDEEPEEDMPAPW